MLSLIIVAVVVAAVVVVVVVGGVVLDAVVVAVVRRPILRVERARVVLDLLSLKCCADSDMANSLLFISLIVRKD